MLETLPPFRIILYWTTLGPPIPYSRLYCRAGARSFTRTATRGGSVTRPNVGAWLVASLGIAILLSAVVLNPWGPLYNPPAGPETISSVFTLTKYFRFALVFGAATLVLSVCLGIKKSTSLAKWATLFITCSLIILSDRFLLVQLGLSLWIPDAEARFKHRPSVETNWSSDFENKPLIINSLGYHDTEFPIEKPPGELRVLAIGDSVTMGHGVRRDETFSHQLEGMLQGRLQGYTSVQVINAGVQGYSTREELAALRQAMVLQPDLVLLGFCMNDVTGPYVLWTERGGTGIDYHGVQQIANPVLSYLAHETGYGRMVQRVITRAKRGRARQLRARYSVRLMTERMLRDAKFEEAWNCTLNDLEQLYAYAARYDLKLLLLVFPYRFQVTHDSKRSPQELLQRNAAENSVSSINFTQIFEYLILEQQSRIDRYFLDSSHLTAEGHRVVASRIRNFLLSSWLVEAD